MLTNKEIKLYSSLQLKKFRKEHQLFIVEGVRNLTTAAESGLSPEIILVSKDELPKVNNLLPAYKKQKVKIEEVDQKTIERITSTENPQGICGIFPFFTKSEADFFVLLPKQTIYLDNINDPGNLGTILRTADWFGFNNIVLSNGCADVYNPKTVRSAMGSLFNLRLFQIEDDDSFLHKATADNRYKVISTGTGGEPLSNIILPEPFILVFSNEANGTSNSVQEKAAKCVAVQGFGKAESLNVAVAAGIILHTLKLQNIKELL
ncbi:MAG: RNA methyltransferase [Ignavibacteriaceae bacterium]|nr:RNA methyltransferase [Ignavibacteriaceae bacterium]